MVSYNKRLQRTMDAIQMKKVDKIPFSFNGPAYLARNQGLKLSTYITDFNKATDAAINFVKENPGIDSIHSPTISPYALALQGLSEIHIPGKELSDDELWQVNEQERMTMEDYEKIVEMGYAPWYDDYMRNRIGDPMPKLMPFVQSIPETVKRLKEEAHVPHFNDGGATQSPIEGFSGARQLMNFFIDIMEEPELVKTAMDKAMEFNYNFLVAQMEAAKPTAVWIGGWRAAPQLMSHDTWMEFVWPYLRKLVEVTIEHNAVPVLHFDSCWDREMETLKELEPKKCLLMLDGATDMRHAREVLDDRMCLMGDVPATMLAFGSDTEVYDYVTKLIDDVGPKTGLIVSSGCDCPLNAKSENVKAMIQATSDYRV